MAAASGVSEFEKLTRRHGVKLSPLTGVSVEEYTLAVGEIVGHGSVKSASRLDTQERDSSQDMQVFSVNEDIQVEVEGYFPDLQLFQESTKQFMKSGDFSQAAFTDQEMYRLKKLSRFGLDLRVPTRPHMFPLSKFC